MGPWSPAVVSSVGRVQLSLAGRVSCRSLVLHRARDRFPTCPQQQRHVLDAIIASAARTMCPWSLAAVDALPFPFVQLHVL